MVALSKTVVNTWVWFQTWVLAQLQAFLVLSGFEILNSFFKPLGAVLTQATPVVAFRELRVILDRIVEVCDGQLMIAHICIDNTSCDVNSFIIFNCLENLGETFQSVLKSIYSVVHESQMEPAAHKVLLNLQGLQIPLNGHIDEFRVLLACLTVKMLSLALEAETLRV